MNNYYEFLGIEPTATQAEINEALDRQYNHWRRLVTHHEQETVEQATQALRILEQVRAALTDAAKRSAYNASIGLGAQVGGLADPKASVSPAGTPFAQPVPPATPARGAARVDAWVCARCQTPNSIGTRHCRNCGNAIGIDCPNCGRLTEATTRFCSNCGVNIQEAAQKRRAMEDEQRKQQELREAERVRIQREQERQSAEQRAREQTQRKQQGRRSCVTWIAIAVGMMICCGGAIFVWPLLGLNLTGSGGVIPNSPVQQATTDPLLESMVPQYKGSKINVTAELQSVSRDGLQIEYHIQNISQAPLTLAFLSSDILVSDNLGNNFPEQWGTQPIRDDLDTSNYSSKRDYSLNLAGYLNPSATELQISFPALTDGETPFRLTIPLVTIERAQVGMATELVYPGNDSFDVNLTFTNSSPYFLALRFNSSDVTVTDDLGNVYQINEYDANQQIADGVGSADNYYNSREYGFTFEPALAPAATSIQVQSTIMGKAFSQQIPLSISDQNVRYEAKIYYASPNSSEFSVQVNVFNLGAENFIVRTDGNQAYVNQGGQTFRAQSDSGRIGGSIGPGSSSSFTLYFDGSLASQNDLTLILPVVSGATDIQMPISPNQ